MMEKRCWNCANEEDGTGCADCFAGETPSRWVPGPNYVPPTNADRIRAMSDEELVKFMQDPFCDRRTHEDCTISYCGVCDQCILDWLRQPWEEDADG